MKTAILRVKKLSSMTAIRGSGQHTWREIPTHNADAERTSLNEDWRPVHSSGELLAAVDKRLAKATEKAAKDPVLVIEYLITAHQDAFNVDYDNGYVDADQYFKDSLEWLEAKHGKENIVAVNIQNDESAPHMVAYVVPLVEVAASTRKRSVICGKNPDGSIKRETREYKTEAATRLSAYHYFGTPAKLSEMQTDFAQKVGVRNGLRRGIKGSRAKHVRIKDYYKNINRTSSFKLKSKDIERRKTGLFSKERDDEYLERLNKQISAGIRPAYDAAIESLHLKPKYADLQDLAGNKDYEIENLKDEKQQLSNKLNELIGGLSDEQINDILSHAQKSRATNESIKKKEAQERLEARKRAALEAAKLAADEELKRQQLQRQRPEPSPKSENHDNDLGF